LDVSARLKEKHVRDVKFYFPPTPKLNIRNLAMFPDSEYWAKRTDFEIHLLEHADRDMREWTRETGSERTEATRPIFEWEEYLRRRTSSKLQHLIPLWRRIEREDGQKPDQTVETDTEYEEDDLIPFN
jgi:hypothetical protein